MSPLGTVSCTLAGVACVFTLRVDRTWEVATSGALPVEVLAAVRSVLDGIAADYDGPAAGPFGPGQLAQAAAYFGGTAQVEPRTPPSGDVVY